MITTLRHRINNNEKLEYITKVSPDELAPQLGSVVRELYYNENKHINEVVRPFVETTVITENYRQILKSVFQALRNNGIYTAWLNLDMGSGKTHLLTLLTYLIYSYDYLKESLQEYEKLGLDEDIVKHTALFIVDLRTPSEVFPTFLLFFAKSLRKVNEEDAAKYIEDCINKNEFPLASEFVKRLRGSTRLLIIVDELHHAILTYKGTESERRVIINTLDFITQLINYLREHRKGFVVLVASARSDTDEVEKIRNRADLDWSTSELIIAADNLLRQIGRLAPVQETQWLSVNEAKQIILKKLGADSDIFHKSFDKFIARVISAESDIPHAQHLRSLIKAMAIYTKNAINWGHPIVSPASFSEEVISALFPTDSEKASHYRTIYGKVIEEINSMDRVSSEEKEIAKLIVNIVFTASITERDEQLIEIIKAYKLGRGRKELLPAASEGEIVEILRDLGKDETKVMEVLSGGKAAEDRSILSNLPHIHFIKADNTYLYFVALVENVVSIFNRHINERFKKNLENREGLVDKLLGYISGELGMGFGDDVEINIVRDYNSLENSTKGLDPNKMHLIIYADPDLVKYLEKSLRGSSQIDLNQLINMWFKDKGLKDLSTWLAEHNKFNLAIAVPVPSNDVIRNVAIYQAIEEAISMVVNDYLLEYEKSESGSSESLKLKRFIEAELSEIHRAIEDRFIEAMRSIAIAIASALRHVYIYECMYDSEAGIRCAATLKNVEVGSAVNVPGITVQKEKYNKLLDQLYRLRHQGVDNLVKDLVNKIKNYANFVTDVNLAHNIVLNYVINSLKEEKKVEKEVIVSKDMNAYLHGNKIFYIPPNIVIKAAQSITIDEVREKLGSNVKVERYVDEHGNTIFRVKSVAEIKAESPSVPLPSPPQQLDELSKAIEYVRSHEGGIITLTIEFNKDNKSSIITYLHGLRRFIKNIEVKPHDERG